MKARLVTALVILGVVGGGGSAVLAASDSNNGQGSANSQHCPPNSPGAGKEKTPGPPGNKCGHPEPTPTETEPPTTTATPTETTSD